MRVRDIDVATLEVPLRDPVVTGVQRWKQRRITLLSLRTDTGLQGVGEVASESPAGVPGGVPLDQLHGLLHVELEDAPQVRSVLRALDGSDGAGRSVRSAAETAIEVLAATAAGRSLARWLDAGSRSEVQVNALVGMHPPEVAAETAAGLVTAGFGCLKLKGGGEPLAALDSRVGAVREAVGPTVALRVDLNGSYDESSAADALARLARWDIEYVEQPVPAAAGPAVLARLRSRGAMPIAADESVTGVPAARRLLEAEAVDVLVVKPARVGGVREAQAIIEMARAAGTPVTVSTLLESGVGIAAALHLAATVPGDRAHGLATGSSLRSDLLLQALSITGGRMTVPTTPGLGIRLDTRALKTYASA